MSISIVRQMKHLKVSNNIFNMILSAESFKSKTHPHEQYKDIAIISERGNVFNAIVNEIGSSPECFINEIKLNFSYDTDNYYNIKLSKKYRDLKIKSIEDIPTECINMPYSIKMQGPIEYIKPKLLEWIAKEYKVYSIYDLMFAIDGFETNWNLFKELISDDAGNIPKYIFKNPIDISTLMYFAGYYPLYERDSFYSRTDFHIDILLQYGLEHDGCKSFRRNSAYNAFILMNCFEKFKFQRITDDVFAMVISETIIEGPRYENL